MKIKNAAKKIGSAIYEMEQKSAEKPRILGSSQKQIIFLVLIIIFSFWLRAMCAFIFKTSFGSVFSKYTIVYHKTREKKMKTRRYTEIRGI